MKKTLAVLVLVVSMVASAAAADRSTYQAFGGAVKSQYHDHGYVVDVRCTFVGTAIDVLKFPMNPTGKDLLSCVLVSLASASVMPKFVDDVKGDYEYRINFAEGKYMTVTVADALRWGKDVNSEEKPNIWDYVQTVGFDEKKGPSY